MAENKPLLTVAVCTHNRAEILAECLEALLAQQSGLEDFELLVVDNASTDATADVAICRGQRFPYFRYLREETLGLSHARNTALREAAGEWVAFLDDDALADPDYVQTALELCHDGSFACFGGSVRVWRRDPLPIWFLDVYEAFCPYQGTLPLPLNTFAYGCNMVLNRAAAIATGGFDPAFGVKGQTIAYGEETDLQMRLRERGGEIGFASSLRIRHHAIPERYTILAQLAIRFKAGAADQMISRDGSIRALLHLIARLALTPGKALCRSLFRMARKQYRWQNALIDTTGALLYVVARIRAWPKCRRSGSR